MKAIIVAIVGGLLLLLPALLVVMWASDAAARLEASEATPEAEVAVARAANETYCTPELKVILRRVLQSCGLLQSGGGRGCQPLEARNVATMDDADFNALFVPMQDRGAIVQFEQAGSTLDASDTALIERIFADQRGASYFFVVSRASPEGSTRTNSELSRQRAEAVLGHLQTAFESPELEQQVGLLWLGEEYAQLDPSFCAWQRSDAAAAPGAPGAAPSCTPEDLNRSAFITWIDCRL